MPSPPAYSGPRLEKLRAQGCRRGARGPGARPLARIDHPHSLNRHRHHAHTRQSAHGRARHAARTGRAGFICRRGTVSRASSFGALKRMQALERRLGVRLVERTTRQLHFTSEGLRLVEKVSQASHLIREAEQEAAQELRKREDACACPYPRRWGGAGSVPCWPNFPGLSGGRARSGVQRPHRGPRGRAF